MNDNELKRNGPVPLYTQLAAILRDNIRSGRVKNGSRLSQRTLGEKYGVSKKNVADAFDILESEGLLITKPKSGSVVNISCWLPALEGRIQEWSPYIDMGRHIAAEEEIYSSMRLMSSEPKARLSGSAIHKGFNYSKPIKAALKNVIKRMDETDELNNINTMGLPAFRRTLARHMEERGILCGPENIMVTNNPVSSVAMIINSLMRGGMKFFHETPCILNSCTFGKSMGLDVRRIPMDSEGMRHDIFIDNIRKISGKSILYVNPANQYPTGVSLSKGRRDALMAACVSRGIPIIENDMLRDFYIDRPHPKPMKSFDKNGQIIYIGSLINTWVNIQISWIAAEPAVLKKLNDVKAQNEIITNTLTQLTADEMLKSGLYREYLDEYRPIFRERLYAVKNLFEKYFKNTAEWNEDSNIYYQWLKFREPVNTFKVFKRLRDVAVHSGYFFDRDDLSHFYINPFIDSIENLEYGLSRIAEAVRELYGI